MQRETALSQNQVIYNYLSGFISENKQSKITEIIENRTRYITIVLEDIFQPHNASAVLRTCDCFGIQDVHIIENRNKYEVNPDVALGSSKWIDINKYTGLENNTASCISYLKEQGYRIVATTPHKNDYTPENLPLDKKIALVFGTEMEGLSETGLKLADDFVKIPMYGFTESLNISVSAALLLRAIVERLHQSGIAWQLTDEEKLGIRLQWVKKVLKKSDLIEKEFLKKINK
jgi:tRNA (guanosine-2'-O-)-methyltransferase